jgi:hypothetical protein
MCVCEDPVTGRKTSKELVRVSIVDGSRPATNRENAASDANADVVLDSLVAPSLPVVDDVSRVHGIAASDLAGVAFSRRHAQAALRTLCCDRSVLVGHAVANDLEALQFHHTCVVDTALTYSVSGSDTAAPALRDVAAAVLDAEHNAMTSREHDSRVDARSSLLCAAHLLDDPTKALPVAVARRPRPASERKSGGGGGVDDAAALFAHRIPSAVDGATLGKFLARATGVALHAPAEILASGDFGKSTLVFKSPAHAALAFETLAGDATADDKAGREQRKLFLDEEPAEDAKSPKKKQARPYCKLRRL